MEGTCTKSKCYWWKKHKENCPNFIQTWWTAPEKEPILIDDCAPKRTLVLVQELSNRLVGVEKSQEQMRNESILMQVAAKEVGKKFIGNLEQFVKIRDANLIEQKEL